jgi:threonine/homoserine/homoserine lactone efflux protein
MLPTHSLLAVFIFSFLMALGAVVSPGPISTAIVSQAPRRGWQVGPLVASGHSFMELLIVLLITFGLGAVLAHPSVQTAIALLGGVLLAWMGVSMLVELRRGKIHLPGLDGKPVQPLSSSQLFGLGMVATASNPFWYAWWVTVAAGYLAQAQAVSAWAISAFYLGHITVDYAWDTMLSAVIGSGRRWMTDRLYRLLLAVCAIFFLYLGWVFLTQGIGSLLK